MAHGVYNTGAILCSPMKVRKSNDHSAGAIKFSIIFLSASLYPRCITHVIPTQSTYITRRMARDMQCENNVELAATLRGSRPGVQLSLIHI